MPAEGDRSAARAKWPIFSKHDKRTLLPHEIRIQAGTLYRIRFIFSDDLREAWSKFGGLGPQMAHLSAVFHIGVTENIGEAFDYHRIARTEMQE